MVKGNRSVLQNHAHGVELVFIASNLWWAGGTHIEAILRLNSLLWSRLFGVPTTLAVNR